MSAWLVVVIAVMTYGSRALGLVAMPDPPARLKRALDRVPAPLFAALAAMSLVTEGEIAGPRTLVAALGALALAPTRSLLLVLIGGVAGYALALLF